jgi:hypothetical protein
MVAAQQAPSCQHVAIGRSAAGVPRTFRLVHSSTWARRLTMLLKRLMP